MTATHALRCEPDWLGRAETHCGKKGHQEEAMPSEFSTIQGFRFEIAGPGYKPTCLRCLQATRKAPTASKAVPNV